MRGSAIRCVGNHDQSIWKNGKFDPRKYKMAKYIQTPPIIYDYVAKLSCCAKPSKFGSPNFPWGIKKY